MKQLSSEYHKQSIIAYQKKIVGVKQSYKAPLENYI